MPAVALPQPAPWRPVAGEAGHLALRCLHVWWPCAPRVRVREPAFLSSPY